MAGLTTHYVWHHQFPYRLVYEVCGKHYADRDTFQHHTAANNSRAETLAHYGRRCKHTACQGEAGPYGNMTALVKHNTHKHQCPKKHACQVLGCDAPCDHPNSLRRHVNAKHSGKAAAVLPEGAQKGSSADKEDERPVRAGHSGHGRSFLEMPQDGEELGSRGFEDKDKDDAYDCYGAEEELEYMLLGAAFRTAAALAPRMHCSFFAIPNTPPRMEQAVPMLKVTVLGSVRPPELATSSSYPHGIPSVITLQAITAKNSHRRRCGVHLQGRYLTTMEQVSNPLATLRGWLQEFSWHSGQRSAQGHIPSTSIPTHLPPHLPQNPSHPHSHRSRRQEGFRVSPEPATVAFGYLRGLWRNFDFAP